MKLPFRCILCPTDLTESGDAAVDLAYALAGAGATVHLVHVLQPALVPSPLDGTPVLLGAAQPEVLEAIETNASNHLKRLIQDGSLTRGVRTQTHVVQDLDAASVIEREARRLGADVIVAGTHGRRGMTSLLLGSVAKQLVKHARLPVVLVRPERD